MNRSGFQWQGRQATATLAAVALVACLGAPSVGAQAFEKIVFLDGFAGVSTTMSDDLDFKGTVGGSGLSGTISDVDFDEDTHYGGRIGMWLRSHPAFGLAVDASVHRSDIDTQSVPFTVAPDPFAVSGRVLLNEIEISNVVVSFDLVWRRPWGLWTPYVAAGPAVFISDLDDTGTFGSSQSESDTSFGVKAAAGLRYALSHGMSIFGEYRFLHGAPEFELGRSRDPITGATVANTLEVDINTHAIVGGISFSF